MSRSATKVAFWAPSKTLDVQVARAIGRFAHRYRGWQNGAQVVEMGQQRLKTEGNKQLAAGDKEMALLKQMRDENLAKKSALEGIEVLDATIRFSSVGPEKMSVLDFKVHQRFGGRFEPPFARDGNRSRDRQAVGQRRLQLQAVGIALAARRSKTIRLPQGARSKWNQPEVWARRTWR